ncbi:hypothetical protein RWD71_26795, partial [Klebsiella pneumoniae]|uniref:hypothetical protein n=1 Tax=Klebsiella pneumoniae TaxID=573 RepID=UPI002936537F
NNNTVGGVGVFTGATIILLVLKAFNLIQITWLQCLIPMAVGLAVGLLVGIVVFIMLIGAVIITLANEKDKK